MKSAKIETISVTLTRDEAYALCNKLTDEALVTHGGFCEFDQIKLLQRIGKDIGELVGHGSAENALNLDVPRAVQEAREAKIKGKTILELGSASLATSGRQLTRPQVEFSLGRPYVNQAGILGMATIYVARDGTVEMDRALRDPKTEYAAVFQVAVRPKEES